MGYFVLYAIVLKQHLMIHQHPLLLAESMPERFHIMDGTQDRKLIEDEIWEYVKDRFDL